jgi:hypothetical protein
MGWFMTLLYHERHWQKLLTSEDRKLRVAEVKSHQERGGESPGC